MTMKDGINKFYKYNILNKEIEYKNNIKNGIYKEYHNNSTLYISGFYENDKKCGNWKEYDIYSILISECNYKYDKDINDSYYHGKYYNINYYEIEEGTYLNGQKHGEWKYSYLNRKSYKILKYEQGLIVEIIVYDDNNNIKEITKYKQGSIVHKIVYENGIVKEIIEYKDSLETDYKCYLNNKEFNSRQEANTEHYINHITRNHITRNKKNKNTECCEDTCSIQ